MSQQTAEAFVEALGRLEANRDLDSLVALFADDCEVGNTLAPEKFHGREGARQFWTKYRDTFGEIRSTFRNRIVTDERAALEWRTEGTTTGGQTFAYEGVSILEMRDGRITRFRAYFNADDLSEPVARA
jgi:steroid delta-isomerase-like uncharacterized protein